MQYKYDPRDEDLIEGPWDEEEPWDAETDEPEDDPWAE